MFDGPSVAAALKACGVTHVVWVPDSELGAWDAAFSADPDLSLIRVCREGEAVAVAGGLHLGGKRPLVMMQCTGLFEAGDSLRNFIHDLKLPLFFLIGVRSYHAHQQGKSADTCPRLHRADPAGLAAARTSCSTSEHGPADLAAAYRQAQAENRAGAVLLAE